MIDSFSKNVMLYVEVEKEILRCGEKYTLWSCFSFAASRDSSRLREQLKNGNQSASVVMHAPEPGKVRGSLKCLPRYPLVGSLGRLGVPGYCGEFFEN
ncbi:MAG: hypothetical protein M1497_10040 [Nitrospirae bacterium]|nr:hypothetical protein [Nitrospirota bacterium]